jgi:hypothetical protein
LKLTLSKSTDTVNLRTPINRGVGSFRIKIRASKELDMNNNNYTNINYRSNGLNDFNKDSRFRWDKGQGQTIAVIDVGFRGINNNGNEVSDRFIRQDIDVSTSSNYNIDDSYNHGLLTSGVAASVAGRAKILPIQVGRALSNVTTAIEYATAMQSKYNITVINMSLGDGMNNNSPFPQNEWTKNFYTAVGEAEKVGITVVVSAGNSFTGYGQTLGTSSFASLSNTIGVSATTSNGVNPSSTLASWSQRNQVTTAAPGSNLQTFGGAISGTSASAPFATGFIPLLQNIAQRYMGRKLIVSEMKDLLKETATPLTGTSSINDQINVYAAADLIYKIGRGLAPDTLNKTQLTNEEYTFPRNSTDYTGNYYGNPKLDVLTGRSTTLNNFTGSGGRDLLVGGVGKNVFHYNDINDGGDTLLKFRPGRDKIDISSLTAIYSYEGNNPLGDGLIQLGSTEQGNSTLVRFDPDGFLGSLVSSELATISNIRPATIGNYSFIF